MDKNNSPIAEALDMLNEADGYFKTLLKDHPSVLLFVCSGLLKIRNRLAGMTGGSVNSDVVPEHQPITNFMGEEVTYGKKIEQADLTADEADMQAFRDRVSQLYVQFDTISPEGLVHSATIPEEQLIIRGVAKLAGVDDYEDREIDEDFIEDIAIAIMQKKADAAQQAAIDKQLEEDNTLPVTDPIVDPLTSSDDDDSEEEEEENDDEQKEADMTQQVDQPKKRGRKPGQQ
ncbi:hypothetical protein [Chitinophaga sp. LS1]|uniref:hypothetical protein n=1 Tax=Chitinophaga sp. LS1 TaxID=3051176 RepID=UPI002AAB899A|nr:hypothetical protein [Chitinophaga sp. LS1]WPV66296.1 hypothetical protein QQL36_31350 [Chitinophaga sp. LS1]